MRLNNRVALVTGAASGIDKEIARTFPREDARVAIAALNQGRGGFHGSRRTAAPAGLERMLFANAGSD
jgi:3-hydroxybutyrate dehydrogenase